MEMDMILFCNPTLNMRSGNSIIKKDFIIIKNFSLLDEMLTQVKPFNLTYLPIMDNYPEFDHVPKIQLGPELKSEVGGSFEKGCLLSFVFKP